MKHYKYLKITAYVLIQALITINFSWAFQENVFVANYHHTLAPALQINNNLSFLPYYNVDVVRPWNKVAVVLKEQRKLDGCFNNTIEVSFKNDQIGIFSKILNAINKEGNIIWFEMEPSKEKKLFKFGVITQTKKQRSFIIDEIKKLDDLPIRKIREIKRNKWVLTLSTNDRGAELLDITTYLAKLHINVAKFLTPNLLEDGKSQFVFELDVPSYLDIDLLKRKLSLFSNKGAESIQITSGQVVDRILDDFLIKEINIQVDAAARKDLRLGIQTVAARHISQARKDRRTPFLMHPVEITKIISNEINMFTPELLGYLSNSLKIKKEEVVLTILMATLLHDAVEDGDISQEKLYIRFGKLISEIVRMVTKTPQQRDKKGEIVYLNNLVKRTDMIGLVSQILKIADRIHNLRTLKHNIPEFQRKIIFSTIDNFVPYFIDEINIDTIENRYMKDLFSRAIELFDQQLLITLKDLEIGPEQRIQYDWEEKCRLNQKVLRLAEKNNLIAHGVSMEKGGRDRLFGIMEKGYIEAKSVKINESAVSVDLGMVVFAGVLRPQRSDENHDDYQAESPGDYKPYYVILAPVVNDFRVRLEIAKRKVILPGFYRAMPIDQNNWGISSNFHIAYLVPSNTDRQYFAKKMMQAVQNGKIDSLAAFNAIAKVITYDEFLAKKGYLKPQSISAIKKNNITSFTAVFINSSI